MGTQRSGDMRHGDGECFKTFWNSNTSDLVAMVGSAQLFNVAFSASQLRT